ncbi:hypothetical protein QQM_1990, partial [Clostridioides difficile P2]
MLNFITKKEGMIQNGEVDTEKTRHITDDEWEQGYILAC